MGWMTRVRFPAQVGIISPYHCILTGSGAHPASHPMGIRGFFPQGKVAKL